jgi:hypothetical protein
VLLLMPLLLLFAKVVDLMCEAEDRLEITAEAPIPLQRIFLPWILEASAVDECVPPFFSFLFFSFLSCQASL